MANVKGKQGGLDRAGYCDSMRLNKLGLQHEKRWLGTFGLRPDDLDSIPNLCIILRALHHWILIMTLDQGVSTR